MFRRSFKLFRRLLQKENGFSQSANDFFKRANNMEQKANVLNQTANDQPRLRNNVLPAAEALEAPVAHFFVSPKAPFTQSEAHFIDENGILTFVNT